MEFTITNAQALALIEEYGGYGRVRIYGIIGEGECEGQITAIKSEHNLNRFNYSRIYAIDNDGTVPISKA